MKINCSVVINDDVIAYEDDEVYDLVITLISTATPIQTQSMTLTIVDDDGLLIIISVIIHCGNTKTMNVLYSSTVKQIRIV